MSVKLFALVLAVVISVAVANPTKKSNYIEQENSCRQVCGLCDCDGFYCEDECICECNLEEDENLQCIADMKKECDANGLEYELLMQDSAKERFLREIKGSPMDLNKHLVILKQKRQSATTTREPTVGAAPTSESADVGAAPAESSADGETPRLGSPLALAIGGKSAFAALTAPKLLVNLRERFNILAPQTTRVPFVLPKLVVTTAAPPARIVFPTFKPLIVQPNHLF